LCSAVEIAIEPPYRWFAHCHCSMCRKQFGTPFGTGLGVAAERLRWLKGEADVVHFRASAAFERPFCAHCGAKVPALSQDGRTWNVPAGLLHDDPGARPRAHIFAGSRASFVPITDALPQHAAYPPEFHHEETQRAQRARSGAALDGSCLCGAIAFSAAAAPQRIVYCHCSLCRRSGGAAFVSLLPCSGSGFRWLRGHEHVRSFVPAGSRYRTDFCAVCASPVPLAAADSDVVQVPAGAIDTALPLLPALHTCVASKASWYEITDTWPQLAALPAEAELARSASPRCGV
jgi:hypothetical protein